MGKGSKRRPMNISLELYAQNWDDAFGKKDVCAGCGVEDNDFVVIKGLKACPDCAAEHKRFETLFQA